MTYMCECGLTQPAHRLRWAWQNLSGAFSCGVVMWSSRRKSWNTIPISLTQGRYRITRKRRHVMAELGNQSPRRPHRQKQKPQQRGLASAGRAREELKGMRIDTEREVTQNLLVPDRSASPHSRIGPPTPLPKILDKAAKSLPGRGPRRVQKPSPARTLVQNCAFFSGLWRPTGRKLAIPPMFPGVAMVSDPLTDGWYLCTEKLSAPCISSARTAQHHTRSKRPRWARRAARSVRAPLQDHLVRERTPAGAGNGNRRGRGRIHRRHSA